MTVVEFCIAALLALLLFVGGFLVLQQARRETQKGFWLQKAAGELRNTGKYLALRLGETSYPSTIVMGSTGRKVISCKEKRSYDDSGRLRSLQVNPDPTFDLARRDGTYTPQSTPQVLCRFPVCRPERDGGTHTPGTVVWVDILLERTVQIGPTPLGRLRAEERQARYDTRALPERAFGFAQPFSAGYPCVMTRILCEDVRDVEMQSFQTDELSGIQVSLGGAVDRVTRKRSSLFLTVRCAHPKDPALALSDRVLAAHHLQVRELP